jgi:hypothetical protein
MQTVGWRLRQAAIRGFWEEMVQVMTRHVMENHPEVAKKMESLHKQDPQQWAREDKPKWEASARYRESCIGFSPQSCPS